MSINFNGNNAIQKVIFNDINIKKVIFNDAIIWEANQGSLPDTDYTWTVVEPSYGYSTDGNNGTCSWAPWLFTEEDNVESYYSGIKYYDLIESDVYYPFFEDFAFGHIAEWYSDANQYGLFGEGSLEYDNERHTLFLFWEENEMGNFSDGEMVTIEDIIFSLRVTLLPNYSGSGRSLKYYLLGSFDSSYDTLNDLASRFRQINDYGMTIDLSFRPDDGQNIADNLQTLLQILSYIPILKQPDNYDYSESEIDMSRFEDMLKRAGYIYNSSIYYYINGNSFESRINSKVFELIQLPDGWNPGLNDDNFLLGEPSFPIYLSRLMDEDFNNSIPSYRESNGKYYVVGDWTGTNLPYISEDCYIQEWVCCHPDSEQGSSACTRMKELLFSAFLNECSQLYSSGPINKSDIYVCPFVGSSEPLKLNDFSEKVNASRQLGEYLNSYSTPMSSWKWSDEQKTFASNLVTEWRDNTNDMNHIKILVPQFNYQIALPYYSESDNNVDPQRGFIFLNELDVMNNLATTLIELGFNAEVVQYDLSMRRSFEDRIKEICDDDLFIIGIHRAMRDCLGLDYYLDRYSTSRDNVLTIWEDQEYNVITKEQGALLGVTAGGANALLGGYGEPLGTPEGIKIILDNIIPYLGTWSRIPLSPTTPMFYTARGNYTDDREYANLLTGSDCLFSSNKSWVRPEPALSENSSLPNTVKIVLAQP